MAIASNYRWSIKIETKEQLLDSLDNNKNRDGPILILIKTKLHPALNLKRPNKLPKEYKEEFMKYLLDLS